MTKKYRFIGKRTPRKDGNDIVTGKAQYIDDIRPVSMLHGKVLRSPYPHAKIKELDYSESENVPGFVQALTYNDVPKNIYTILTLIGVGPDEEYVLAEDKVRYIGEPIAAIVAESESAAMEAVSKVRLEIEELPALPDPE